MNIYLHRYSKHTEKVLTLNSVLYKFTVLQLIDSRLRWKRFLHAVCRLHLQRDQKGKDRMRSFSSDQSYTIN